MKQLSVNKKAQHGIALLVLFLMVFTVGATVFLSSVNTHSVEMRQFQDVRSEMLKAKQALISYAMNYHSYGFDHDGDTYTDDAGPGRMFCPDIDNDGTADSGALECVDYVRGRLPENVNFGLNSGIINDTFADIDQQFWYVVSPAFKEITTSYVNHETVGDLSIDGESGYVAVIIAPGEALTGQNRTASKTTVANYLEQGNQSGTAFINSYPSDPDAFNDQVIGIKASELMLDTLRINEINSHPANYYYSKTRPELYAYYLANGSTLPTTALALNDYMKDKGYGWLVDEGYLPSTLDLYQRSTYPYVRYNLFGCSTYWWWFLPESPYSPLSTYVSGTAC